MIRYANELNVYSPSITGGVVPDAQKDRPLEYTASPLISSRPSTWPPAPKRFDQSFYENFRKIIRETMLDEL